MGIRRWCAILLLCMVATLLAASSAHPCDDGPERHCQQSQHLICLDDCAPALLPQAPAPPPPDPMPKPRYQAKLIHLVLDPHLEPEVIPPRA